MEAEALSARDYQVCGEMFNAATGPNRRKVRGGGGEMKKVDRKTEKEMNRAGEVVKSMLEVTRGKGLKVVALAMSGDYVAIGANCKADRDEILRLALGIEVKK
jgi:hypothetical protein